MKNPPLPQSRHPWCHALACVAFGQRVARGWFRQTEHKSLELKRLRGLVLAQFETMSQATRSKEIELHSENTDRLETRQDVVDDILHQQKGEERKGVARVLRLRSSLCEIRGRLAALGNLQWQ